MYVTMHVPGTQSSYKKVSETLELELWAAWCGSWEASQDQDPLKEPQML